MTPDEIYAKALTFTLGSEGGYVVDNGGPTNHGVTQHQYDAWRTAQKLPKQTVTAITHDEVIALYRDDYWNEANCDNIVNSVDTKLAIAIFDTAVNAGPGRAIKILQSIVCRDEIDGICGPGTLGMARKAMVIDSKDLVGLYLDERDAYDERICANDKSPEVRLHGYRNRVSNLRAYLATW
jgi:lysozyme family protein